MEEIFTPESSPPKGHYCQAVKHNGVLYLSGILGITPEGGAVAGGTAEEAKQIFANLAEVLKAGGSGVGKLLKVTVYVADMGSWGEINALYAEALGGHKCARSVVPVEAKLPMGLSIELDAIAACD